MRIEEAIRISELLSDIPERMISPCLNIGASSLEFRTQRKPHIDEELFQPLCRRGVEVIHHDIKEGPGIDVSGDLFDEDCQRVLKYVSANLVLCNNMLEHVRDRSKMAEICVDLVNPGGYLLVSVPRKYPYHEDPIDTGYRPEPEQIAELFDRLEFLHGEVVSSKNTLLSEQTNIPFYLIKYIIRVFLFYNFGAWRQRVENIKYFFRDYDISIALFRKS